MAMTRIELEAAQTAVMKNKALAAYLRDSDWERRRYEIAKEILPFLAQENNAAEQDVARSAVRYADALIKELKKK